MVKRSVRCLDCKHEWTTKVVKPRCSKCGSRHMEEVQNSTIPPPVLHGEADYSKVFTAFDEGKNLIDVVKQGLCDPDTALELWNKYEELKEKTLEVQRRPVLEERIEGLEKRFSRVERFLEKIQPAITIFGMMKRQNCEYYHDGYCHRWVWRADLKVDFANEFIEKNGERYIYPTTICCAFCPSKF